MPSKNAEKVDTTLTCGLSELMANPLATSSATCSSMLNSIWFCAGMLAQALPSLVEGLRSQLTTNTSSGCALATAR